MSIDDNQSQSPSPIKHSALVNAMGQRLKAEIEKFENERRGALYIVATPIGNLSDISLRALAALATADVIYAEDTRHSAQMLSQYQISSRLRSSHDHNAAQRIPEILDRLGDGQRIALISDAGTPLVSDPGFKTVRAVVEAGYPVISLPGPTAMIAALTSAGLPTDTFLFSGFLPSKRVARRKRLDEVAKIPATLIFYEAASRVTSALEDMVEIFGPHHQGVVARELTKRFEQVLGGELAELSKKLSTGSMKGEFVILIAPPAAVEASDEQITEFLQTMMANNSVRDAVRQAVDELGVSRSRAYDLALRLKGEAGQGRQTDVNE